MNATFKISYKTSSTTFYSVKCSRHSMTDFNLNPITKSRRWPLREFPPLRLLTHTTYEIIFASLFRKWFFHLPVFLGERAHHIRRLNQERPEREKHSCGVNYIRWSALLFLRFGLAGKWWYPFRHLRICIYVLLKGEMICKYKIMSSLKGFQFTPRIHLRSHEVVITKMQ